MDFDGATIFVTGGAGFIGSAVIRHLLDHSGARVVNIDKLRTPRTLTESRCPVLRRSDSGLWIPVGDEAA
jgi:nucleoside-diphosphate-sugar epimerase